MKLSERAMLAAGMDPAAKPVQAQMDNAPFRNQYRWGPMGFLSTQAVKRMAHKGWPCKVSEFCGRLNGRRSCMARRRRPSRGSRRTSGRWRRT